ncbi:MAG: DUF2334 domain-containing protein, partial [Woeseiaceae bacterium]
VGEPLPDFWARVRTWQSHGWSIGLHGHQHTYTTQDAGLLQLNSKSEFAGLSSDEQRRKLVAALKIFEANEVHADAWIAPGHSFDERTIEILRDLGITTISDGFSFSCVFPLWLHMGASATVAHAAAPGRRVDGVLPSKYDE